MAVIKVTNSKATLSKTISYISKDEKTEEKLISGENCYPSTALEEMQATKEQFNKLEGRQYYHYVQSFSKTDDITPEKAHQIGKEWAEKNFKGYEVLMATHKDREHIHNHFVVNSVSFEDGRKFHSSKKDLEQLKESSDKICEREGFSVIKEKGLSQEITSYNQGKYQLFKRLENGENVKSYVIDTAIAVDKALDKSTSKENFIENMEKQGYKVNWSDTRKYITFTTPGGEKVRNNNLEKTFKEPRYSKEELQNEFTRAKGKDIGERGESREEEHKQSIGKTNGTEQSFKTGTGEQFVKGVISDIQREISDIEARAGRGIKQNKVNSEPNNKQNERADDKQRDNERRIKQRSFDFER